MTMNVGVLRDEGTQSGEDVWPPCAYQVLSHEPLLLAAVIASARP